MTTTNATARKFAKVWARVERGSTEGERTAGRNVATRLIERKGLRACLPSHPLNGLEYGDAYTLVDAAESMWDFTAIGGKRTADRQTWATYFMALPYYGAKETGRALALLRSRKSAGWSRGVWTGPDNTLQFLNVTIWGVEQAFLKAAASEGWTADEARAYAADRADRFAQAA